MIETGLSSSEVAKRHAEYGYNVLPEKLPPSNLEIFINQLKSPLVYILIVAAAVTFFLKDHTDTIVILITIFLNSTLGYFQEKKANQALHALKKLLHPTAQVIREGVMASVKVEDLVPGDVILLDKGDKVPADATIIFKNRFYVDESILTGESMPVEKQINDPVYMGTMISSGQAKVVAVSIGSSTEFGKIAKDLQDEEVRDSPLKRQVVNLSKWISVVVLTLVTVVFVFGLLVGKQGRDIFTTSVALAVAAVPEGVLIGMTVVLAVGMQRILGKKGLVRNLLSAETLGGVTTICLDKTGTLTQGKMSVADVVGNEDTIKMQVRIANDLDDPILIAAADWAENSVYSQNDYARLDSLPFTSESQYFCCLNRFNQDANIIFLNGAPEVLLNKCTVTPDEKDQISTKIEEFSSQGKRILGLARKLTDYNKIKLSEDDAKQGYEWVGLMAFYDPVRLEVRDSLQKTREAGIKLVIITGDYPNTTRSVLNQLGIQVDEKDIYLGSSLDLLEPSQLSDILRVGSGIKIFARTKPAQKMKIVKALKDLGEVVAMMGDGVNDAPALAAADIGVVVGEAADVAKESSDLILLDSNFKTIVLAIEEGRGIFDNIRKIILFIMSDAFVEILLVSVALFFGLPIPLSATQILWINIISDGFPTIGLTVDPKSPNIMDRHPRSPNENIITPWMKKLMAVISLLGAFFAFCLFYYVYKTTGDEVLARSVAFATVGIKSLVYVFSVRTLREPCWKVSIFNNKWLILTVFMGFATLIAPFTINFMGILFDTVPIGFYWLHSFGAALLIFIAIESVKFFHRKFSN